jgi:hypothetical protein
MWRRDLAAEFMSRGCFVLADACIWPTHEWHLNRDNPFRHIAFDLGTGPSHVGEVSGVPFPNSGLVAIGAVGDSVSRDSRHAAGYYPQTSPTPVRAKY